MSEQLTPEALPDDPFIQLGRVHRDDNGRVRVIEVFYREDGPFEIHQGDEFITFVTKIALDVPPTADTVVIALDYTEKPES